MGKTVELRISEELFEKTENYAARWRLNFETAAKLMLHEQFELLRAGESLERAFPSLPDVHTGWLSKIRTGSCFPQTSPQWRLYWIPPGAESSADLLTFDVKRDGVLYVEGPSSAPVAVGKHGYFNPPSTGSLLSPPRSSVEWFAAQMEAKVAKKDPKGGWESLTLGALMERLWEEVLDLVAAFGQGSEEALIDEAADVATVAMRIASCVRERALTPGEKGAGMRLAATVVVSSPLFAASLKRAAISSQGSVRPTKPDAQEEDEP